MMGLFETLPSMIFQLQSRQLELEDSLSKTTIPLLQRLSKDVSLWMVIRHGLFGMALPGGTTYEVTWEDENGSPYWPGYVTPTFETAPDCPNALQESDINLDYPAPTHR
jgi:hypothetical protein